MAFRPSTSGSRVSDFSLQHLQLRSMESLLRGKSAMVIFLGKSPGRHTVQSPLLETVPVWVAQRGKAQEVA